jgi:hypothetical protein
MAAVGTAFIVAVLWTLEWREPWPKKLFELKVSAKDPAALKPQVEALLKQHRLNFELRGATEKEVLYMVDMPAEPQDRQALRGDREAGGRRDRERGVGREEAEVTLQVTRSRI